MVHVGPFAWLAALLLGCARPVAALKAGAGSTARGRSRLVQLLDGCRGFECLRRYVDLPDESFSWYDTGVSFKGVDQKNNVPWTGYVLNVTSQTWQPGNVDFPLWWHTVVVVVPENIVPPTAETGDYATLTLDFGANLGNSTLIRLVNREGHEESQEAIQKSVEVSANTLASRSGALRLAAWKAAYIATRTRTLAVSVLNLPNEAETFKNDPTGMHRAMDFLKAYTYIDYFEHPDEPERIMDLPNAKAVIRVMDAVAAYSAAKLQRKLERFGVTGYSKLGTATYLVGALDARVKAIAPGGISQTYTDGFPPARYLGDGNWSRASKPTTFADAYEPVAHFAEEQPSVMSRLHEIIDPLAWATDKLRTLPMFWFLGTADHMQEWQRFLGLEAKRAQDFTHFGSSFLEVVNASHEDTLIKALDPISSFFKGYLLGVKPPVIDYMYDPLSKTISVTQVSNHTPYAVTHFSGHFTYGATMEPGVVVDGVRGAWNCSIRSVPDSSDERRGDIVEVSYAWPTDEDRFKLSTPFYRLAYSMNQSADGVFIPHGT